MMSEIQVLELLLSKQAQYRECKASVGKKGSKLYKIPFLAVEIDLLKKILETKEVKP